MRRSSDSQINSPLVVIILQFRDHHLIKILLISQRNFKELLQFTHNHNKISNFLRQTSTKTPMWTHKVTNLVNSHNHNGHLKPHQVMQTSLLLRSHPMVQDISYTMPKPHRKLRISTNRYCRCRKSGKLSEIYLSFYNKESIKSWIKLTVNWK